MARKFDRDRVGGLGWRQGAILGPRLAESAWEHAPARVITIADIELYQRFDADWVSFEDETPATSIETDFRA